MSVKALAPYKFPPADRAELYGDDMLVHVNWDGNLLFCAAACFRAPKAMKWSDFKAQMIDPWAQGDPDYVAEQAKDWRIGDTPFEPDPDKTLAELGVRHKALIKFRG
jgi:phenol hydroxylase P4 protein